MTTGATPEDFQNRLQRLLQSEGLPPAFIDTVNLYYKPLARGLAVRQQQQGKPLIVGINGAQGTGKSTLSAFLTLILGDVYGLPTVSFSLDDLYLTKDQRQQKALAVHPLFKVRGVPGSHDIGLGIDVVHQLLDADACKKTPIPAFDKAMDDRLPQSLWPVFVGKPQVIIVEGWCMGATPVPENQPMAAINELEKEHDPQGSWRSYVNEQLKTDYADFFSLLDVLIMIAAPCWRMVYQWRLLQENKLRERCRAEGLNDSGLMSPQQVAKFIQYYERITRHCLAELPARADYVLNMDQAHRITSLSSVKPG
ncbi:MAG: phosphoribulokinase [Porticoccaceae bacterium]|nr:phosphoribulokinase [Porticoccaceae bacterium]